MKLTTVILLVLTLPACVRSDDNRFRYLVSERDVSELCLRKVFPSIFLSKRVVESNAYVLQLSRREVPYNCSIIIRTEPGNNIILAIKMFSTNELTSSCHQRSNQLVVYEIAETFGGYWGSLPKDFVTPKARPASKESHYTIRTTTTRTTTKTTTESTTEPPEETTVPKSSQAARTEEDVISVEVALLNVSGVLVDSDETVMRKEDDNNTEIFDMIYDVAPRSDEKYDTSVVPLLQFSLSEEKIKDRDGKQRYELDYNLDQSVSDFFKSTKGHTLYSPQSRYFEAWTRNYDSLLKRRKPGKNTRTRNHNTRQRTTKAYKKFKEKYLAYKPLSTSVSSKATTSGSWEHVLALMKSVNKSFVDPLEAIEEYTESVHDLPKDIFEMKHNSSIYLNSNLSSYRKEKEIITADIKRKITRHFQVNPFTKSTKVYPEIMAENKISKSTTEYTIISETITNHANYKSENTKQNNKISSSDHGDPSQQSTQYSSSSTEPNAQISVQNTSPNMEKTLVNHKSWENVVQVAGEIAHVLNHSSIVTDAVDFNKKTKRVKKKRFIEAMPIYEAKPHIMSTEKQKITPVKTDIDFTDIYEFANFVEPIDDEIHGRVNLRSLGDFVSPSVFNICDYWTAKDRQVVLFNSSRILLDFNNFMVKSLTIVATTARTLMNTENRCPPLTLECQVSGVRVCIDSISACDGIPNCGSYDVYDEDRIQCGLAAGLRHNVYLAAFTFLALLCTMLYIIHYWLKRCVPHVSKAFFIYSDGADNMLFVDSIMKSPLDDSSRLYYVPGAFEEEPGLQEEPSSFKSRITSFFKCFQRRSKMKSVTSAQFRENLADLKEVYSFTECELNKMMMGGRTASTSEAIVQTGDSLEMEFMEKIEKKRAHSMTLAPVQEIPALRRPTAEQQSHDELQMLRLCRDSLSRGKRSTPFKPTLTTNRHSIDEDEIRCLEYKDSNLKKLDSLRVLTDPSEEVLTTSHATRKRLRFDEGATMISRSPSHSQEITEPRVKEAPKTKKSSEKTKKKLMR